MNDARMRSPTGISVCIVGRDYGEVVSYVVSYVDDILICCGGVNEF